MVTLSAAAGAFFGTMRDADLALIGLSETGKLTEASLAKLNTRMSVGIVAAAGLMIGESVKLATDFQSTMEWLVTSAGLPQPAMKQLGDSFLQMAGQLGISANDLAKSSYYVLSQLQTNATDTATVMHATAELAKIDNSDLSTTTLAVATAMRDYHIAADGAVSVSDQFRQAVALSNTTVGDFSGNLGKVFQAAQTAHIGLSQVLAAVATLTSEGIPAANASTLLASTIDHLSAVTPAGAQALAGLGINVNAFEKAIDSPDGLVNGLTMLQDALKRAAGSDGFEHLSQVAKASKGDVQQIIDAIGTMPQKTQTAIATIAQVSGGVRGLGIVLGLTGDNLAAFTDAANKVGVAGAGAGKDVEGWAGVQSTLKQKLAETNAGIQSMAIQLGNLLLPVLSSVVGGLNQFLGFLERNRAALAAFGAVLGVVVGAAIINLIGRMAAMVSAAKDLAVVFFTDAIPALVEFATVTLPAAAVALVEGAVAAWSFAVGVIAATWPILLIIAAIGLLAFGIYELVKHWHTVKEATRGIWEPIVNGIKATIHSWHELFDAVAHVVMNIVRWVEKWWPLIFAIVAPVLFAVLAIWHHFHTQITHIAEAAWNALKDYVIKPLVAVFNFIVDVVGKILGYWVGAWTWAIHVVVSVWDAIYNAVASVIEAVWHKIEAVGEMIWNAIRSPFLRGLNIIRGMISDFGQLGNDIVMGIVHGVESAAGALFSALGNLASNALSAAKSALGIGSPSRLFADGIGQWIAKGIAAGITENGHHIHAALAGVTDPSKITLGQPGFAVSAGAGSLALGNSGNVTLHLEVHGSVVGPGGIRAVAQDIWRELLTMQRQGSLGIALS